MGKRRTGMGRLAAMLLALCIVLMTGCKGSSDNELPQAPVDTTDNAQAQEEEDVEPLQEENQLPEDGIVTEAQMATIAGKDGTYYFNGKTEDGISYRWAYQGKKIQNPVEQRLKVDCTDEGVDEVRKEAANAPCGLGITLQEMELAAPATLELTLTQRWDADRVLFCSYEDGTIYQLDEAGISQVKEGKKKVSRISFHVTKAGGTFYLLGGSTQDTAAEDSSSENSQGVSDNTDIASAQQQAQLEGGSQAGSAQADSSGKNTAASSTAGSGSSGKAAAPENTGTADDAGSSGTKAASQQAADSNGTDSGSGTDSSGGTDASGGTNSNGGTDASDGTNSSGGTDASGGTNSNGGTDASDGQAVEQQATDNGSAGGGSSTANGQASGAGSEAGSGSSGASTEEESHTCTFSIDCSTILANWDDLDQAKAEFVPSDGWILRSTEVSFSPGETVFDILKRVCDERGIQMESSYTPAYGSYYIEGINQLYEFDCGSQSGWMYCVNGWFPNYGCSSLTVEDGDVIEWRYTCNLGSDVGNAYMGD